MSYYGYNPAEFRQDFSWVGNVGNALAKTVSSMPELIQLNKEVKSNRYFKQQTYEGLFKSIDNLSKEEVTNLASSMQIQYDPSNPEDARNQIKQRIPDPNKLGDKMTNEEYAIMAATDFVTPLFNAAESPAGGGVISKGQLIAKMGGGVQNAFLKNTVTGQMYQQGQQDHQSNEIRNEGAIDLANRQDQREADRYTQISTPVKNAMNYLTTQFTSYDDYPKLIAAAKKFKNEFTDPNQAKIFDNELQSHIDNLYRMKNLELQESEQTSRRVDAELKRKQATRDRIDPVVKPENMQKAIQNQQTLEYNQLDRERSALNKIKTPSKPQKDRLAEIDKRMQFLDTYVISQQKATDQNLRAGGEVRVSDLNTAVADSRATSQFNALTDAVRSSSGWVNNANTKYKYNPNKLNDILKEAEGDQYLYEVKPIKVGDTTEYQIVPKNQYSFLKPLIDNPNDPNALEQVRSVIYKTGSNQPPNNGSGDYERIKTLVESKVPSTTLEQLKKQNPGIPYPELIKQFYTQYRSKLEI